MPEERKMSAAKDSKRKATGRTDRDTWAEVFAELDASGISDGLVLERDLRPAEERLVLDVSFDEKQN